jgi:hypothetical protein
LFVNTKITIFVVQMGEDEFYDAVENALDKLEEEQEYRDKLKLMSNAMSHQPETISEATQHQLWSTINTVKFDSFLFSNRLGSPTPHPHPV